MDALGSNSVLLSGLVLLSGELRFPLRLDYRREKRCLPVCRHACWRHCHWKPLFPKPVWQQQKLLYGVCNFSFGNNVCLREEQVGKMPPLVTSSIHWHHSKITRFWSMEVVIHLLWEWFFWWLLKESYFKANHQKTCVYPKPVSTQILCKMGNGLIKYKAIFCWSKRHLSVSQACFHFSYESGCMNFKIGNNVTKAISSGDVFCVSLLEFVSHNFLSLFCLESDSRCFAWWSSLTEPFFSLRVVYVCRCVAAVLFSFLLLLSMLTLWGQAQTMTVANESVESVRRMNGLRSKESSAYGTVNQIGNSSLRVKL